MVLPMCSSSHFCGAGLALQVPAHIGKVPSILAQAGTT